MTLFAEGRKTETAAAWVRGKQPAEMSDDVRGILMDSLARLAASHPEADIVGEPEFSTEIEGEIITHWVHALAVPSEVSA